MSIIFDVIIYIILVLGIMLTTVAFLDASLKEEERYIRIKRKEATVKLTIEIKGMNEQDKLMLVDIIEKGKFENIYDVVDECTLK